MPAAPLPIVLIPGFMLDDTLWDDVIAHMPQDRTYVRAHLQHGHTIHDIARHMAADLPPRFVLVGFSLGGYVARSLAAQYPERIAALALIATSLRPDTPAQKQAKENAAKAIGNATFKGLPAKTIATSVHPDRAQNTALIQRIQDMGLRLGKAAFETQSVLAREDIPAVPRATPALVIAADTDLLRSAAETQELADAIAGGAVVTIPQSGHMIPLEQPAALAQALQNWLQRITV